MKLGLFVLCFVLHLIAGAKIPDIKGETTVSYEISPRIVAGSSPRGEFPFQCALEEGSSFVCGCVIISNKYVLTSGECATRLDRHNAQVLVGTYRLSSGGTRYQVKTIIPHEKYNNGIDYSNNIAVIQVQGQIEFNETVQPIKLSKIPLREGDTVIATGWGLEDGHVISSRPDHLAEAELITISHEKCEEKYRKKIHESNFCATNDLGKYEGQGRMCYGDIGGPLVFRKELYGITSFYNCGVLPDGFASIAYFYDWILEKTLSTL